MSSFQRFNSIAVTRLYPFCLRRRLPPQALVPRDVNNKPHCMVGQIEIKAEGAMKFSINRRQKRKETKIKWTNRFDKGQGITRRTNTFVYRHLMVFPGVRKCHFRTMCTHFVYHSDYPCSGSTCKEALTNRIFKSYLPSALLTCVVA